MGCGKSVKTGIVGAGIWGANHALALSGHARADLALICDLDETGAKRTAEKFGRAWTISLDSLASSDVEAVIVATPDHLHRIRRYACFRRANTSW